VWFVCVVCLLWEQEVGGSNPLAPTSLRSKRSWERRLPRRSWKRSRAKNIIFIIIVSNYDSASHPPFRARRKAKAAAPKPLAKAGKTGCNVSKLRLGTPWDSITHIYLNRERVRSDTMSGLLKILSLAWSPIIRGKIPTLLYTSHGESKQPLLSRIAKKPLISRHT